TAHRGGAPPSGLRRAARRGGEGASRRFAAAPPGPRGGTAHRRSRQARRLHLHRRRAHHQRGRRDLLRERPGGGLRRRRIRRWRMAGDEGAGEGPRALLRRDVGAARREARLRPPGKGRGGTRRPASPRRFRPQAPRGAGHRLPHRSRPRRASRLGGRVPGVARSAADAPDHRAPRRVASRRRDPRGPRPRRRAPGRVRRTGRGGVPERSMTRLPRSAAVLGGGALGSVLVPALLAARIPVALAWDRARKPAPWSPDLHRVRHAELLLIAVTDSAVAEVCRLVAHSVGPGQLVAHCAGALDLEVLASAKRRGAHVGSLHPLRAVPRGSGPGILRGATAGIASDGPEALDRLAAVARALGMVPIEVGGSRPLYHAAAMLAAGATVALFARAVEAFQAATGVPEEVARRALLPLATGAL